MREGVTVTNIMADGTVCRTKEEFQEYCKKVELPDLAKHLILEFIKDGAALRAKKAMETNDT